MTWWLSHGRITGQLVGSPPGPMWLVNLDEARQVRASLTEAPPSGADPREVPAGRDPAAEILFRDGRIDQQLREVAALQDEVLSLLAVRRARLVRMLGLLRDQAEQ